MWNGDCKCTPPATRIDMSSSRVQAGHPSHLASRGGIIPYPKSECLVSSGLKTVWGYFWKRLPPFDEVFESVGVGAWGRRDLDRGQEEEGIDRQKGGGEQQAWQTFRTPRRTTVLQPFPCPLRGHPLTHRWLSPASTLEQRPRRPRASASRSPPSERPRQRAGRRRPAPASRRLSARIPLPPRPPPSRRASEQCSTRGTCLAGCTTARST